MIVCKIMRVRYVVFKNNACALFFVRKKRVVRFLFKNNACALFVGACEVAMQC